METPFDQLPERIRQNYSDLKLTFVHIHLGEEYANLHFVPEPTRECLVIHVWRKNANGDWEVFYRGTDLPELAGLQP